MKASSAEAKHARETTRGERRWVRGPDPTIEPCPKGNKSAGHLWRARKAILDLEQQVARLGEERTHRLKAERSAYDAWQRRERLDGEHEGVKAMRIAGIGSAAILQLADLGQAKNMTIDEFLACLAKDGGPDRPDPTPRDRGR